MTPVKPTALAIVFGLLTGATAHAQTPDSASALVRWVAAVRDHKPGTADGAASVAAGLTYTERVRLNPAMQYFLKILRGDRVAVRSPAEQNIVDAFRSVRLDPGVGAFIRRAAILHTDATVFADRFPYVPDDAPAAPPRGLDATPLLFNQRLVKHTDGRFVGAASASWHLVFARSLIDMLFPGDAAPRDPRVVTADDRRFGGEWYHATASYLLAAGNLAELKWHLEGAASVLPDDPRIVFDRGCYAEALGLPYNQVLRDDPGFQRATAQSTTVLPSEERTDEEAERLYRRALELNDQFTEARVRLARLLARRARYDDALVQLGLAQASPRTRVVAYYSELVAGRIAQALTRYPESLQHYQTAASLYPDAQSALLGASQAAVMAADPATALSFVQRLGPRSGRADADPWGVYHIGAGRDVNALLASLWSRTITR